MSNGFLFKINKLFVHIEIVHMPMRVILIKFIRLKLFHSPEIANYLTSDFRDLDLILYPRICSAVLMPVESLSSMFEWQQKGLIHYNSFNITRYHFITLWIWIILKIYILVCERKVGSFFQEQKIEPEFGNNCMFSEPSHSLSWNKLKFIFVCFWKQRVNHSYFL